MQTPIVIIELRDNTVEALYSNADLSFIIVHRNPETDRTTINGPYTPTIHKADLAKLCAELNLPPEILTANPTQPYL
jgi:hypothetical protein